MPDWNPNWDDVRWNASAAGSAAHALDVAASKLDEGLSRRSRYAKEAQAEWRGLHRDTFDEALRRMQLRSNELVAEYRRVVQRLRSATAAAQAEQRHREAERVRWREEKRREEEEARRRRTGGGGSW